MATGDASKISLTAAITAAKARINAQIQSMASTRQVLFGLNADGTANANSLSGIDWNPSHDSIYFSVLDKGRNQTMLSGNWRYKDSSAGAGRVLAVTGEDPSTRSQYAAFGGNPFGVAGNAKMDLFMKNMVTWLSGQSTASGLKVVTAHLPGSTTFWFQHEAKVRTWFNTQFPGLTLNGVAGAQALTDDVCDGDKLDACLQGANLLVIGRQQARNTGNSSSPDVFPAAYNSDTVMKAVISAQARGVAVLYLHHDGDTNDLSRRFLSHFGLQANENYWEIEGLLAMNPASTALSLNPNAKLLGLLQRMETGSFSTDWSGCVNDLGRIVCESTSSNTYDSKLTDEFTSIAKEMRTSLRALDASGTALFSQPGYALEKLMVLLGDKYRESVSYPLTKETSGKDFFKAYFSDMAAYINRPSTTTARNLGNFSSVFSSTTAVISRQVTVAAPEVGNRDYMTGLYALPGRTFTLTRTDTGTHSISVGINMLRDTTRVYNSYERPTMLSSPRVPLVSGKSVTLTSPFGGPLYVFLPASVGAPSTTVQVSGVITHPVLRNVNDPAQVAAFQAEVNSTNTNWVGISTDFLTVHSNLTNFRATLKAYNNDISKLTSNIWTYMVKDTYELAGFNSATTGTFVLPASVSAFCTTAGWDCTGIQHRRDVMQHVISDNYAACGAGCSGNPYDQNWALEPLGWGESHEIGHNLQKNRLNIYADQSTEVSNNIFPVHKQMQFNKATAPAVALTRNGTSAKQAFDTIKASMATADPSTHVYNAIWSDTAYAANNGLRLSFYRQLAELSRHYNPNFTDGWELYTLLYLLERNVSQSVSKNTWAADASKFGFGNYSATDIGAINGNDFMLIASSGIVGKDMRPVFSMWGITFSAAADAQLASLVLTNGWTAAAKLLFPMDNVNRFGAGVGAPLTMLTTTIYP